MVERIGFKIQRLSLAWYFPARNRFDRVQYVLELIYLLTDKPDIATFPRSTTKVELQSILVINGKVSYSQTNISRLHIVWLYTL
ncbi:hypothetical protein ABY42_18715 (plasmid) [Haloferax gibbonsii]|uniref:Uncharacterized protein n=1 Tax=Haloferax gibbonsii TaxID=35746 RepID=A0A0K1IZX7_HALGI|nr:hypothetical protein ABY42_18715 [Haloferax gibbonsii]